MTYRKDILAAADILGVTPRSAVARLTRLGYTDTCPRCYGSGHYSYNTIDGTPTTRSICYTCIGRGVTLQRITKAKAHEAKRRIDDGEIDAWKDAP